MVKSRKGPLTSCGSNMGAPDSVPTLLATTINCRVLPALHTAMRCRRFFSGTTNVTGSGRGTLGRNARRVLLNTR